MDGIANFVASLVVDGQVVLLTTMLLDFRHDFLFAIAADLPITVLRPHIGALKVDFAFALRLLLRNVGIHVRLLQHPPPFFDLGQYPDDPIVVLGNKH
jgi:hypothetical protein